MGEGVDEGRAGFGAFCCRRQVVVMRLVKL